MKKLTGNQIRQMWLDFFASKGHEVVPSASLIPVNDPTLLWINAGVAPLKKYFDGREVPKNKRMVNAQKAIRTNDIENVGKTARHHTFFEMLGNFSIGDYFREEALTWAVEVLTSPQWFGFDINKLYFTIYPDDVTSYNKWVSLGVPADHIIPLAGNFWEIGEGPCGPDTEIFYDRGEKYDPNNIGIDLLKNDIENDRYIEIWNIVFSQYNAEADKPRSEYKELPSKNIDTGMGLERMACIIQEVETNYDTDLFMPLINKISEITGVEYNGQMAFKVIADHIRSVTFAVSDGAMLSNEGRGYVLRRVLRRAIRYGKKLGMTKPFIYQLVDVVCDMMSGYYQYLNDTRDNVRQVIKIEEEKFLQTLETGEKKLVDYIQTNTSKVVSKEVAFLLYDTFGFPLELTLEVANEYGFTVDEEGFKGELKRQKENSRNARNDEQSMNTQNVEMMNFKDTVEFVGYTALEAEAKVIAIFENGKLVNETYNDALVVFDKTPFYAESGGQAGDKGKVNDLEVLNTVKLPNLQPASLVKGNGTKLTVGDTVKLVVDKENRQKTSANHSATHLLNEGLRIALGKHVHQQGSSVSNSLLRFDFNNFTFPTNEELITIEKYVKASINKAVDVKITEMAYEDTKSMNVQALFGEKYDDVVRVVQIDESTELCGGTHVINTKDIEDFAIISIESKGSGIFRIEAATKSGIEKALMDATLSINKEISELHRKLDELEASAKADNIEIKVDNVLNTELSLSYQYVIDKRNELALLREAVKEFDKKYNKLKKEKMTVSLDDFESNLETVGELNRFIFTVNDMDTGALKDLADRLADKYNNSVVFIANVVGEKVIFVCKSKVAKIHAGMIVKEAAVIASGNGGGRPDFAQAGGKDVTKVEAALNAVREKLV